MTSDRVQNPGTIRRLTASLLVSKRYDEQGNPIDRDVTELQELRQIVINALGIELKNGETADELVTVNEMVFATDPLALQSQTMMEGLDLQKWLDISKNLAGIVLGIGVIFYFTQMLKKTKPEEMSIEVLQPEQTLQSRKLEDSGKVTPEMLNELIKQRPANIGVSLKEWIGETENSR